MSGIVRRAAWTSLASAAWVLAALAGPAMAQMIMVPAERREIPFQADMPACGDPAVIGKIGTYFRWREERFWNSGLAITGIDRTRQIALRPWGADFIPRRFCEARVHLSNGRLTRVNYVIIEDAGIIGATWGVEWCVHGLDRNMSFAPHCKMARP